MEGLMWPCLAVSRGWQEGDWLRGLGLAPHPVSLKGMEGLAKISVLERQAVAQYLPSLQRGQGVIGSERSPFH